MLKIIFILVLVSFCACSQNPAKPGSTIFAEQLNKQVITLAPFIDNADSVRKAISLLNEITKLDSNNFLAHYNKLIFYSKLQEFDSAIFTMNKLIQLRPLAHDLYLTSGILHERIGDTISSKTLFEKSLSICNAVLDTMSKTNSDYKMLVSNKAMSMIMLGDTTKAVAFLDTVDDSPESEQIRENLLALLQMSREELVESLTSGSGDL